AARCGFAIRASRSSAVQLATTLLVAAVAAAAQILARALLVDADAAPVGVHAGEVPTGFAVAALAAAPVGVEVALVVPGVAPHGVVRVVGIVVARPSGQRERAEAGEGRGEDDALRERLGDPEHGCDCPAPTGLRQ